MRIASPTFAEAVFPDGWQVGGVRLHPFSLGHALLLQRLGNAYAEPSQFATGTLGSLAIAAWCCSRPAAVAAETKGDRRSLIWIRWFGLRWRFLFEPRHREFLQYGTAAWNLPEFDPTKRTAPEGLKPGAEPLHVLWMHRRRIIGDSEAETMDCPLVRARLDHLVWAEQEGGIIIRPDGESEREQRASAARENAEWDRQLRAKQPAGGANG